MLHTIIKENAYQDSVVLMLLTNKISTMDGVNRVSIMMGTPANKDIMGGSGLRTPELEKASANDLAIVLLTDLAVVPREKPHAGAAAREQPRASPVIAT